MRKILCVLLTLGLLGWPNGLTAQIAVSDPEVTKGVRQVEGDYDAAILTLDSAARRLAADPAKARELSYAYLYLGIAYLGKGHEAAARAKFREAVSRIKDLSLSPDKFSPKVIDLFEAVKEETAKGDGPKAVAPASQPAPTSAPAAPSASAPAEGGGSGKTLLFVGLGVAAAAAVAYFALKGGGEECLGVPEIRSGRLSMERPSAEFPADSGGSGRFTAELSWTGTEGASARDLSDVHMVLLGPSSNPVAEGIRITETSRTASWPAGVGAARVRLALPTGSSPVAYQLKVLRPCP